ncbi:dihydrofolate reductase family protein [Streptococcus hyointestinalis]|uniref:dihydrofolate reductase family protein n=1 Tax=Streptococcus hyointestinalis TaxID=1337 RepID=UPI003D078C9D
MQSRKLIAYLGLSLDGYIATLDERVDWLEAVEGEGDNGYGDFYAGIDTVLMGRKTYDWINQQMAYYPYPDKTNYVFTKSPLETPYATVITENPEDFVRCLKAQPGGDIWLCGGGCLVSSLLNSGLVDRLHLTFAPIILGKGISLYQNIRKEQTLKLLDSRRHGQFVELIYQVNNEENNDISRKNQ